MLIHLHTVGKMQGKLHKIELPWGFSVITDKELGVFE